MFLEKINMDREKKENINQQKEILSLLAIERDSDIVKTTDFSYFFCN